MAAVRSARAALLLCALAAAAPPTVTHLGGFPCRAALTAGPGFLALLPAATAPGGARALAVSLFTGDPLESDAIAVVAGIDALLLSGNVSGGACVTLTTAVTWPNDVEAVALPLGPRGAGGNVSGLLAPGGFLVPGKSVGAVTLLALGAGGSLAGAYALSAPVGDVLNGSFYHRAVLHDVDGDGLVDVVAARASKPLTGAPPSGELVWLRQPAAAPLTALPWAAAVLASGAFAPDVLFAGPLSLRGDGDEQVFAASFFTGGGLSMVQCAGCGRGGQTTWTAAAAAGALTTTVLDAAVGPAFDVAAVDLNGDGALDLLLTNHVDNATTPGATSVVVAYEAPAPPAPLADAAAWARHVLAAGFVVREPGDNQAAPGGARAHAPARGGRPWLALSGDGDQRAYVLAPASADPADWAYARVPAADCGGTVGEVLPLSAGGADFLLVPCYDAGRIEAYAVA